MSLIWQFMRLRLDLRHFRRIPITNPMELVPFFGTPPPISVAPLHVPRRLVRRKIDFSDHIFMNFENLNKKFIIW